MLKIYNSTIHDIDRELVHAHAKFPAKLNSKHEGYAILKEQVDNLWDKVKSNASSSEIYDEATQIAAIAIRVMQECCTDK